METNCTDDYHSDGNIVVEQTSLNPKIFVTATVSTVQSNALPIDLTFYKKNDHNYALLEKHDVMKQLKLDGPHFRICNSGLINKITLLDFPPGQYILSLCGVNCATARYNKTDHLYEFDLTKDNSVLNAFKNSSIEIDEPILHNRYDYLNFDQIDTIRIISPQSLHLETKQTIRLHGFFSHDGHWNQIDEDADIYLHPYNTYRLNISHPTESLDIATNKSGGLIILQINGNELCRFESQTEMRRIKFNNPHQLFNGRQSDYLCEEINKNVINMSKINHCVIIALNCQITEIYQNCYNIYNYPDRTKIFAN
jgi:hypothetical protein